MEKNYFVGLDNKVKLDLKKKGKILRELKKILQFFVVLGLPRSSHDHKQARRYQTYVRNLLQFYN